MTWVDKLKSLFLQWEMKQRWEEVHSISFLIRKDTDRWGTSWWIRITVVLLIVSTSPTKQLQVLVFSNWCEHILVSPRDSPKSYVCTFRPLRFHMHRYSHPNVNFLLLFLIWFHFGLKITKAKENKLFFLRANLGYKYWVYKCDSSITGTVNKRSSFG